MNTGGMHKVKSIAVAALSVLAGFLPVAAMAGVPPSINYQGFLTGPGGGPVNGSVRITFALYAAAAAADPVWDETHEGVRVAGGVYSVVLGSVDPEGNPLNPALFSRPLWLGIQPGADEEMTPRRQLTSVPYAMSAGGVSWNSISGVPAAFGDAVDSDTFSALSCEVDQSPLWNGSAWTCAAYEEPAAECRTGDTAACYDGPQDTLGVGECRPGSRTCDQGTYPDLCTGDVLPSTEVCDGLDNDCSGQVDDFTTPLNALQAGVCAGSRQSCTPTEGMVDDYSKVEGYEPDEVSCDGLDNDCDGETDNMASLTCTLTAGVCASTQQMCLGSAGWGGCDYGPDYQEEESLLDLLDNDCDGGIDETVIDREGMVGEFPLIVIGADGLPLIFYLDETSNVIKVAHCTDTACRSAGFAAIDAENASYYSRFMSVAIGSDGLPILAIPYHEQIDGVVFFSLQVTHCEDRACTSSESVYHQLTGDIESTSIAIGTDGFPVIAFDGEGEDQIDDLWIAHCGDLTCSSATITEVVSGYQVSGKSFPAGEKPSITIGADGLPVISFMDVSSWSGQPNTLQATHCENVACTSVTTTTLAAGNTVTKTSKIAIGADGLPIIGYVNYTRDDVDWYDKLKLAYCDNSACTTATLVTLDTLQDAYFDDIAMTISPAGRPVIAYQVGSDIDWEQRNGLWAARCADRSCSSAVTAPIQISRYSGDSFSIAFGSDGLPIIADYETLFFNLNVVKVPFP